MLSLFFSLIRTLILSPNSLGGFAHWICSPILSLFLSLILSQILSPILSLFLSLILSQILSPIHSPDCLARFTRQILSLFLLADSIAGFYCWIRSPDSLANSLAVSLVDSLADSLAESLAVPLAVSFADSLTGFYCRILLPDLLVRFTR